jgi:ABC-type antimicrobial peptide transport system permease subunit
LYGVIGYLVKQRQFEFGIRIALGASRRRILANVTSEGLRLVIAGLVVGMVLSVMLARTISALLVAVTAYDPVTFVSVPLLVILVGVAATLVPAYRAMAAEPTDALRAQ